MLLYTLSALVCTWLTCFCNLIILSLPKGKCRIKMCSMHTQAKEHHLTHAPGTKTRLEKIDLGWDTRSCFARTLSYRWPSENSKNKNKKQVNGSLFAVALPLLPVTNTGRSHRCEHILFNSLPADFPVPATQSESTVETVETLSSDESCWWWLWKLVSSFHNPQASSDFCVCGIFKTVALVK